ncbi:putative WD-40 repeat protein [Streptomyces viridochromogenes Tue57]|uniref:Putative WD-40 repeat protein n=1 Tax=Streptomyces viridochromogenes Tue57 TaxID=1160705 RepID=L8P048_STRVR|nr:putative WD-40 repeat protein [Streptomyces viridochromogenes Tue57]
MTGPHQPRRPHAGGRRRGRKPPAVGHRHPAAARRPLTTPGDAIDTPAFGADNSTLYAGGTHVARQTYTVDEAKAVDAVRSRTRQHELTRTQWQTYPARPAVPQDLRRVPGNRQGEPRRRADERASTR